MQGACALISGFAFMAKGTLHVIRQELLRGIIMDYQGPSVITRALNSGREGFLMHSLERDEGRRAKGALK